MDFILSVCNVDLPYISDYTGLHIYGCNITIIDDINDLAFALTVMEPIVVNYVIWSFPLGNKFWWNLNQNTIFCIH